MTWASRRIAMVLWVGVQVVDGETNARVSYFASGLVKPVPTGVGTLPVPPPVGIRDYFAAFNRSARPMSFNCTAWAFSSASR
jgi:hypothetical protein